MKFGNDPAAVIERKILYPIQRKIDKILEKVNANHLVPALGGLMVWMCVMLKSSMKVRSWTKSLA